jgi:hypothetical protein
VYPCEEYLPIGYIRYILSSPKDAKLVIFRVARGEVFFWTMENNMQEAQAPQAGF